MFNPILDLARVSMEIRPEQAFLWPTGVECDGVSPFTRRMVCYLGRWLVRLGRRLEQIGTPVPASLPQGR